MKAKYRSHVIGWLLFLGYDYFDFFSRDSQDFQGFMLVTSYNLIIFLTFYFSYSYLSRLVPGRNALLKMLLVLATGIIGFIFSRYFIEEILYEILFGFSNYYRDALTPYVLDNIWRAAVPVTAGLLIRLVEKKNEDEKYQLRLEQEKTSAELSFLRSQINPHFLFNTMSFLYAEAFTVDEKLANTILKFSELLRYGLESTKKDKISLEKELEILNNYIEIFRSRFENRCYVQIDSSKVNQNLLIEPLLLLPFVENAFKHGISSNEKTPIQVKISSEENRLSFTCYNRINQFQKDAGSGIGIDNVRKRLDLLYPDQYNLEINDRQNKDFQVKLDIDL